MTQEQDCKGKHIVGYPDWAKCHHCGKRLMEDWEVTGINKPKSMKTQEQKIRKIREARVRIHPFPHRYII